MRSEQSAEEFATLPATLSGSLPRRLSRLVNLDDRIDCGNLPIDFRNLIDKRLSISLSIILPAAQFANHIHRKPRILMGLL
ncbi:hypothetical protein ACTZWT_14375 [Rhodopseudomonas sp. NSM]